MAKAPQKLINEVRRIEKGKKKRLMKARSHMVIGWERGEAEDKTRYHIFTVDIDPEITVDRFLQSLVRTNTFASPSEFEVPVEYQYPFRIGKSDYWGFYTCREMRADFGYVRDVLAREKIRGIFNKDFNSKVTGRSRGKEISGVEKLLRSYQVRR